MLKFILPTLYISFHLILGSSLKANDTNYDSYKFLSRYYKDSEYKDSETCRYYSSSSTISFKEDKVFSLKYNKLNEEISKQIKFLEGPSMYVRYKATFMSVILSATGKNEHGKIKRIFDNLYVREEKDGTPTILTTQEKDSAILTFSSDDSPYFELRNFKKQFTFFNLHSDHALFNLSSFKNNNSHEIISKYNNCYKDKNSNSSHAEPLCLAALLTLPSDTFENLLPKGYQLMYYEIHFLSNFDACLQCHKFVWHEIIKLKKQFGQDLFIFYHSWYPFIDKYTPCYQIKFTQDADEANWDIVKASFNLKDYNIKAHDDGKDKSDESRYKKLLKEESEKLDLRSDLKLTTIPSYYIGIIHSYEGKTTKILT